MAPHSNTLAWKIPWMEEPRKLRSMGSLRVRHDWATSLSRIGEGNGSPLQYSCLENPRDGGAWWANVYGVTQSRTRLKWLSSSSSSNYFAEKNRGAGCLGEFPDSPVVDSAHSLRGGNSVPIWGTKMPQAKKKRLNAHLSSFKFVLIFENTLSCPRVLAAKRGKFLLLVCYFTPFSKR